jgi:hypothetical protein
MAGFFLKKVVDIASTVVCFQQITQDSELV